MKYCPNCRKEMTGEFCSNCGYPNNQNNNSTINRDELLNAYAGKNAAKVYNRGWNWCAFLFGPVYYLYRKLWLEALLLWVANGIINFMFSKSFITALLSFALLIISAILFSKLYSKKANQKIDEILSASPTREQALLECQRQGGTATWVAAIFGVIYGIIIVISLVSLIFFTSVFPIIGTDLNMNICQNICPAGEVNRVTDNGTCICEDGTVLNPNSWENN